MGRNRIARERGGREIGTTSASDGRRIAELGIAAYDWQEGCALRLSKARQEPDHVRVYVRLVDLKGSRGFATVFKFKGCCHLRKTGGGKQTRAVADLPLLASSVPREAPSKFSIRYLGTLVAQQFTACPRRARAPNGCTSHAASSQPHVNGCWDAPANPGRQPHCHMKIQAPRRVCTISNPNPHNATATTTWRSEACAPSFQSPGARTIKLEGKCPALWPTSRGGNYPLLPPFRPKCCRLSPWCHLNQIQQDVGGPGGPEP